MNIVNMTSKMQAEEDDEDEIVKKEAPKPVIPNTATLPPPSMPNAEPVHEAPKAPATGSVKDMAKNMNFGFLGKSRE